MDLFWISVTLLLISLNKINGGSVYQQQLSIVNECPAQEDIPKCSCTSKPGGLSLICKSIPSDPELQNNLKILRGLYLNKLEINHYKANSIETDLWKGLEIEHLSLTRIDVNDASFRRGKRHFQGLEKSLQTLTISNSFNGHRPLLNLQLDHLENLEHAVFERNTIPEVGNDWFTTGPKNLKTLIFESNNIEELGDKAFDTLSNLKLLAVAGNHITSISRTMLPRSATKLSSLDLAYNKIRTLPQDIFSEMPALTEVNLDYNFLHSISKDIWSPLSSQLTVLNLKGNVLQCDENMQWICTTTLKDAHGKCSSPQEKNGVSLQQFCKS